MSIETRNKGLYQLGRYLFQDTEEKDYVERKTSCYLKSYENLVNKANVQILKNLVYRPKKSATIKSSFEITTRMYNRLKEQFNITGRYKNNIVFNDFFQLINKRYDNAHDYYTYSNEGFKIKLTKHKALKYNDEDMNVKYINQNPIFSFKFIKLFKKDKRSRH